MKLRTLALVLAVCLIAGLFAACGSAPAASSSAPAADSAAEAPAEATAEEPAAPSEEAAPEAPASAVEPEASAAEAEAPAEPAGGPCTVTFPDGQTFEATVGEDFVFFIQCDAPGDMGQPLEGEEGAGVTVSDGTVSYSNVGLGGPYSYPTSELVTVSGFTGDFEITFAEAVTFMDATYTIYTDEQDIADAIAFAEAMAAQMAANPMPGGPPPAAAGGPCTVTFPDGQTFEATVGEDFVFFIQCDAPGDMGQPLEGEEGAGVTVSDGTVSYSNVGLGGPYSYPTSELVTVSGFTGDFEITFAEAVTFMDATYTIYTDEQEIADAIAFAEAMAAQMTENPMP